MQIYLKIINAQEFLSHAFICYGVCFVKTVDYESVYELTPWHSQIGLKRDFQVRVNTNEETNREFEGE